MTSLRETFQEYFKLRLTTAAAGRLSESTRSKAIALLLLGRQKSTAAEQLWGGGHRAEGLRMASDAFALLLDCARTTSTTSTTSKTAAKPVATAASKPTPADTDDAEASSDADTASASATDSNDAEATEEAAEATTDDTASAVAVSTSWSDALKAIGTSSASIKQVQTAVDEAAKTALPTLEGDVLAAHETLFTALREATTVLETALDHLTRTPTQLRTLSRVRQIAWGAAAAVFLAGTTYLVIPREVLTASASAYLTDFGGYPPSRVVDGDTGVEWLLPNGVTGWVEIAINRPRELNAVRLLNARNPPYFERATRDYHIEAFAGNNLVGSARGTFEAIARGSTPEWRRIPLRASGVTRVRIHCDSFHGPGGGVAEVAFE